MKIEHCSVLHGLKFDPDPLFKTSTDEYIKAVSPNVLSL